MRSAYLDASGFSQFPSLSSLQLEFGFCCKTGEHFSVLMDNEHLTHSVLDVILVPWAFWFPEVKNQIHLISVPGCMYYPKVVDNMWMDASYIAIDVHNSFLAAASKWL